MNYVTINVSGIYGSGKTTIASKINRLLKQEGYEVTIENKDGDFESVSSRVDDNRLNYKTSVLIKEVTTTI
jgi:uridine kinase